MSRQNFDRPELLMLLFDGQAQRIIQAHQGAIILKE